MFKFFSALAVLGMLFMPVAVQAQAPSYDQETPKELFEGATRMMMKALELLIKTVPQYEAPVVLENGDILIRRKQGDQMQPDADDTSSAHERI